LLRLVSDLAVRQHGVVSAVQLLALGLSRPAVSRLVAAGWLRPVFRGVYSVGRGELTADGRCMAGVLAMTRAFVSHASAAGLWGLIERRPVLVEVTVAVGPRRSRSGLTVHRSANLTEETTRKRRIPVTRPARTVIDMAERSERRSIERLLDATDRLSLCTEGDLLAAIHRHPGRRGAARVKQILAAHDIGSTATANDFEELFLAICDDHGISRPVVNRRRGAIVPDFRWPEHKLIVETDGWASHRTRLVFERDRERDIELQLEGWRVLRFTWRQLTERPDWVAAKVLAALDVSPR
jgi:hypothetical protein